MQRLARLLGDWSPYLTVALYKGMLALLLATCRWRITGLSSFQAAATRGQCAVILWHDRLLLAAPLLCRYAPEHSYVAVVSRGREGKLLARLAASYRQGRALQVPRHGRAAALKEIIHTLQRGEQVLVITPDGPRGPRHQVKPGIALAAVRTGAAIIPVTWRASRFWQLSSWDRMVLPKPFSTIEVAFGDYRTFQADVSLDGVMGELQTMLKD